MCVGIDGALDSKIDTIIASHRDHGWAYIRGVATTAILAEVTGTTNHKMLVIVFAGPLFRHAYYLTEIL